MIFTRQNHVLVFDEPDNPDCFYKIFEHDDTSLGREMIAKEGFCSN